MDYPCLRMDYPCLRMFTKLLKQVYFIFRQKGHGLIGYTDDQFIQDDRIDSCFFPVRKPAFIYLGHKNL